MFFTVVTLSRKRTREEASGLKIQIQRFEGGSFMIDQKRFPLFAMVKADHDVTTYIGEQNKSMKALHFTEHSFAHVGMVTERTAYILETLGYDDHTIDLALTAAWMHDIGNIVNRVDHSQTGALMAFTILNRLHITAEDIAPIICAIGNHDEGNGVPVSNISAALILADKSDVRRSRVQEKDEHKFDIHDRVNYSVTDSELKINKEHSAIKLKLGIDTRYGEIGEYFEICMERMLLCKKAANFLKMDFHLIINEQTLM
jgi:metal-dependent HD superfamily phosphatase/phosphodiesterase